MFRFRPSRHWKQLYFTSTIASIILPANPLFSISWKLSRSFFFPSSAFGCLQREFYILNFRILWFIQTDFNQYVSSPPETVLDCVININFWYLYFLWFCICSFLLSRESFYASQHHSSSSILAALLFSEIQASSKPNFTHGGNFHFFSNILVLRGLQKFKTFFGEELNGVNKF